MRRFQAVIIIGFLAGLTLVADACKKCTCKHYAPETAEATYCRYHREAVWDYVEQATDTYLMKVQLTRLQTLYEAVEGCGDMDCIFNEIQADSVAPGFAAVFVLANADAEDEVDTAGFNPATAGKALLCGLRHGILDWRSRLGGIGVEGK